MAQGRRRRRKTAAETIDTAALANLPRRALDDDQAEAVGEALAVALDGVEAGATAYTIGQRALEVVGILAEIAK